MAITERSLSSSGILRSGNATKTFYDIDGSSRIKGSVSFFDVDPAEHDKEVDITIAYKGNEYYPSTIKFAPNNGSWRIQLKGDSPTDRKALSEYGRSDFVDKILVFKKIATDYYLLETILQTELQLLKNGSIFYSSNGINKNSKLYGKLK